MHYFRDFEKNLDYYFSEILEKSFAKPHWIYISLSHKCNYNCLMCGVVKILKGYELSREILEKSLDEICNWKWDSAVMFTGGEPFLRKDIFELISYSVNRGLKTELVSNGSLINEDLAFKIVSSGLQNIAVSLDGAKEETHDFIREKGAFKKTLNAIDNLVAAKRKNGFGPQISVWTTIMKKNIKELFDVISLVKSLGVDCLVYHPVIVTPDDMQNTSPDAPFWINGDDINILKDQIDKIIDYQSKNGLVAFLHDPYLWVEYFKGTLTKKEWKCNPFVFLNIGPDGEVRSCGSSFGNIQTMSLGECLNTKEAFQARRIMKVCQKPCLQTCWANPESDSLIKFVDNFIFNIRKITLDKESKRELLNNALSKLMIYEKILKTENA